MTYEQAEQALLENIKSSENYQEDFKGFDFGDESYRGYYTADFEINDRYFIFFEGHIYFTILEEMIEKVEIESIKTFSLFDEDGNLVTDFLTH